MIGDPVEIKERSQSPFRTSRVQGQKGLQRKQVLQKQDNIHPEDVRIVWNYTQIDLILCPLKLNLPTSASNIEIKEIYFYLM